MNWKYHLITLAIFITAIYSYVLAPVIGSIFLVVGVALEGFFWARLFKGKRAKRS